MVEPSEGAFVFRCDGDEAFGSVQGCAGSRAHVEFSIHRIWNRAATRARVGSPSTAGSFNLKLKGRDKARDRSGR